MPIRQSGVAFRGPTADICSSKLTALGAPSKGLAPKGIGSLTRFMPLIAPFNVAQQASRTAYFRRSAILPRARYQRSMLFAHRAHFRGITVPKRLRRQCLSGLREEWLRLEVLGTAVRELAPSANASGSRLAGSLPLFFSPLLPALTAATAGLGKTNAVCSHQRLPFTQPSSASSLASTT